MKNNSVPNTGGEVNLVYCAITRLNIQSVCDFLNLIFKTTFNLLGKITSLSTSLKS